MTFTDGQEFERTVEITETMSEGVVPPYLAFGLPTLIIDDAVYQELAENKPEETGGFEMPSELFAFDIIDGDSEVVYELMDQEEHPGFNSRLKNIMK
ncbi:hypothetical protein [Jeotgalicoccus sp. WY2]|uniref:hypothetical protein n=1 Tax=Jeotgalicoccus sp. WY2 TaxID=2708346 RepID=UPI0035302C37